MHRPARMEIGEGETVESPELGAIRVLRRVGQGGMGRVYEACRPNLPEATFAIKFLDPALLDNADALARFEGEARRLSELRHRNIVRVLGYGRTQWGPCMLMELLHGRPLSRLVASQGGRALDRGLAYSVIVEVLEGLHRVHEKGLVHRDVKSDNVFLAAGDGDVVVKLIDFGTVKGPAEARTTGAFVGTPTAAAPEQLLGQPIGYWTDIYQVGVLAYELLAGRHPFQEAAGKSFDAIARAQIFEVPPSLDTVAPGLPPEIVETVMTMLAKDPKRRVRPGKDGRPDGGARAFRAPFRDLLREIDRRESGPTGPDTSAQLRAQERYPSAPPRTSHATLWAALGVLVALAGLATLLVARLLHARSAFHTVAASVSTVGALAPTPALPSAAASASVSSGVPPTPSSQGH